MPDLSDVLAARLAQEASLAKEQWKVPRMTCPVCSGQPFQTGAHCRGCNGVGTVVDEAAFRALLAAVPEGEDLLVALTAELRKVEAERDKALAQVAQYEGAICWDTTCLSCATVLDSMHRETERREQAEAAIGRVRALAQRAEGYGFDLVFGQIYDVLDGGDGLNPAFDRDHSPTPPEDLRTAGQWQAEMPDVVILDPDGWRRDGLRLDALISREEYLRRRARSTVSGPVFDGSGSEASDGR